MNTQQQNQCDLQQQMQAIADSKKIAPQTLNFDKACPNCKTPITNAEVLDNICWTCQKELDE